MGGPKNIKLDRFYCTMKKLMFILVWGDYGVVLLIVGGEHPSYNILEDIPLYIFTIETPI